MDRDSIFRYRTKDGTEPESLPRVFFSCHPDDFGRCFDEVCDLLFSVMDIAVYYTEGQDDDLSSTEAEEILRGMRTLVIPLSSSFLQKGCRAKDHDMPFASENGIEVLPLVMEEDLDNRYNIADLIGDIPYIDVTVPDDPDISFSDRIYRYLVDRNDPGILRQYHALAQLYSMKGRFAEAADNLGWVAGNRRRVLGEDAPDTLSSMNALADALEKDGRKLRSMDVRRQVLELLLGKVPEMDPGVLLRMNDMAVEYDELGEHEKAFEIKKKVLEERMRILGEEHRETLIAMSNLAYSYGELGDMEKKLEIEKKTYEIQCRVLGPDDPSSLITLSNMAYSYGMLGDREKASELYGKVSEARKNKP